MAQTSHHRSITAQVSVSKVREVLSTQQSLALRRLLAWGLEASLLVGSVALPWGLGEMVRQNSKAEPVPLNPASSWVQRAIAQPLGLPRQRLVSDVPPLTNLLWFTALGLPVAAGSLHIHYLAKTGKTWPKAWLGLQVVSLDNAPPGYRAALVREGLGRVGFPLGVAYLLWLGSGAFPALPWLGGMALGSCLLAGATGVTNASRRASHDYWAGTKVLLLRGGQLPSRYAPDASMPDTSPAAPSTPAALVASRVFPFGKAQILTMTEEDGGLRAIVLAPLGAAETKSRWPSWRPWLSWPVLAALVGGGLLTGSVGWLLFRPSPTATAGVGQQRDALFLALVENLSLRAESFSDQQAAALALASSQDPRAVTLLVDLLAQSGDPALLDTIQQALVTLGPPAIPHLQRLNLALANDIVALAPDQRLIAQLRQRTVKRTLAKILVLHSGHFNGVDLSGTNLAQVLEGPDTFTLVLEQQHLAGMQWQKAVLSGARLRKAILFDPGADGRPDTFDDWITDFSGSDLTEASLVAAELRHGMFRHASLLRANLSNTKAHHADFAGANASSAWFIAAELDHGQFQGASLVGADLTGAQANRANFLEARLHQAMLTGASLDQADLTRADLSEADLRETSFQGSNFTEANLSNARLAQANLQDANLAGANLSGANLQDAVLTGANLAGANLSGVQFFTAVVPSTNGFIATLPAASEAGDAWAGVDFSKALNIPAEQLSYLCQQGGLHPECSQGQSE